MEAEVQLGLDQLWQLSTSRLVMEAEVQLESDLAAEVQLELEQL